MFWVINSQALHNRIILQKSEKCKLLDQNGKKINRISNIRKFFFDYFSIIIMGKNKKIKMKAKE